MIRSNSQSCIKIEITMKSLQFLEFWREKKSSTVYVSIELEDI